MIRNGPDKTWPSRIAGFEIEFRCNSGCLTSNQISFQFQYQSLIVWSSDAGATSLPSDKNAVQPSYSSSCSFASNTAIHMFISLPNIIIQKQCFEPTKVLRHRGFLLRQQFAPPLCVRRKLPAGGH